MVWPRDCEPAGDVPTASPLPQRPSARGAAAGWHGLFCAWGSAGPVLACPVWGAGLAAPPRGAGGADLAVTSSPVLLLTATITFHLHHRPWDPLTVFACLTVQSSPAPGSSTEVLGRRREQVCQPARLLRVW